jgi:hypothetical protein
VKKKQEGFKALTIKNFFPNNIAGIMVAKLGWGVAEK